jgi:hypothetical protein
MDAMEDGCEIGSGPTAGIENADGGAGEAKGLIELSAEETIDALDHVFDDWLGRVPDAEVFAELGIEGFKKGLVEVGDGLVFAECIEEGGLDAVEGFSGEMEDLLKLDGVESAEFRDLAEKLAKDGDAEIVGGETPVEARAKCAAFGFATPEDPGGEDSVKEGLNEGGAEEMLASFAFKPHAERFLKSLFDGVEAGERMVLGAGAGFAGVGGEEPGNVPGLDERGAVKHDAGEEVGEQVFVFGKG